MIIGQNVSNQLVASSEVFEGLRNKAVFFLRTSDAPIIRDGVNDNAREHLIYGDISTQPLDQLSTLIEDVSNLEIFLQSGNTNSHSIELK